MIIKKQEIVKREIVKSNNLIEGSYKLTTSENRLIDLALSNLEVVMLDKNLSAEDVKSLIKQKDFELLYVYVSDYKKEYNIKNNTIYSELVETANRLYNRNITYFENNDLIKKRWVITCKIAEDRNAVALQFHPDLISDLLVFKSDYTRFDFDVKKYIRSYYACRIYELLKQYQAFGQRIFEVGQLRFLLGIEDTEYPQYSNFKQRILKPAVMQINKVTDLYIELDDSLYKVNKKVEKVKFKMVKQSINFQGKEQISFLDNPDTVPSEYNEYNVVKEFRELLGVTISPKQIDKLVEKTSISIKKNQLKVSIRQYIKEKKLVIEEYGKKNEIKSYLGAMMRAIEGNWTLTYKKTKGGFNDYEQREYDFDDLEKKLLGWDVTNDDNIGIDTQSTSFDEVASDKE